MMSVSCPVRPSVCLPACLPVCPSVSQSIFLMVQGPSPDEVALVEGARNLGFVFEGRSSSSMRFRVLGKEVEYEVLNVLDYTSARLSVLISNV
jgi:magnesium-transporting ATPase (P-type)